MSTSSCLEWSQFRVWRTRLASMSGYATHRGHGAQAVLIMQAQLNRVLELQDLFYIYMLQ